MDWQDISTAPKDGTEILVLGFLTDGNADTAGRIWSQPQPSTRLYRAVARWVEGGWLIANDYIGDFVTNWQPLPEPPGSDPTPAAAEARATKATEAETLLREVSGRDYYSAKMDRCVVPVDWFARRDALLSLPPPEAKEGVPLGDPVVLDVDWPQPTQEQRARQRAEAKATEAG